MANNNYTEIKSSHITMDSPSDFKEIKSKEDKEHKVAMKEKCHTILTLLKKCRNFIFILFPCVLITGLAVWGITSDYYAWGGYGRHDGPDGVTINNPQLTVPKILWDNIDNNEQAKQQYLAQQYQQQQFEQEKLKNKQAKTCELVPVKVLSRSLISLKDTLADELIIEPKVLIIYLCHGCKDVSCNNPNHGWSEVCEWEGYCAPVFANTTIPSNDATTTSSATIPTTTTTSCATNPDIILAYFMTVGKGAKQYYHERCLLVHSHCQCHQKA